MVIGHFFLVLLDAAVELVSASIAAYMSPSVASA